MEWLPFSHAIKWEDILLVVKRKAFDANASGSVMDAIWTLTEEQRAARRAPALSPLRGAPPARSPALAAVGGSRAACACRAEP